MKNFSKMIFVVLILVFGSGCREQDKPRRKWAETDGAIVQRPECSEPNYNCEKDCYVRQASPACDRCCLDQDYLCEVGRPYDISVCKGSR